MNVQQIRNATLKIRYGGTTFLVDPWLQDKGEGRSAPTVRPEMADVKNPLCDLPLSVEQILDGVDFCLVTHIHFDHFTADYLPKTIPVLVRNAQDQKTVQDMGFTDVSVVEDAGVTIGMVKIEKTPALHGENAETLAKMGTACGYVLTGEEKILYLAGDTVFFAGVAETLEQYKPEVIALNCCAATIPAGRLLMDAQDVESVCKLCPEAVVIATHLDGVNHAVLGSEDIRQFAVQRGLNQVKVLDNGACMEL